MSTPAGPQEPADPPSGDQPPTEPPAGPPAPPPAPSAGGGGSNAALAGAFLPLGFVFLILGMSKGIGESQGLTFFAVGIAFLSVAFGSYGQSRRNPPRPRDPAGPQDPTQPPSQG